MKFQPTKFIRLARAMMYAEKKLTCIVVDVVLVAVAQSVCSLCYYHFLQLTTAILVPFCGTVSTQFSLTKICFLVEKQSVLSFNVYEIRFFSFKKSKPSIQLVSAYSCIQMMT